MVAAGQHGLITMAQLLDLGLTRKMVEGRIRLGLLHPVHRGVYAVGTPPRTREAHWLAAMLACGPGAVLSHASAAGLWRIRGSASALIDVISPRRTGRTRRGITVHRASSLTAADITEVDGIPVTTIPRAIIDLATVISPPALEYAIHRAESQRKVTPEQLRATLACLPGVRGTAAVAAIVGAPHHDLDARTRSPWERRLLAICRDHGIPLPEVNRWIPLEIAAGGLEVDFCWRRQRLVVEVDENASHGTLRARRNDPERDRALEAAGWPVCRVAEDEFARPQEIAAKLLRALGE